MILAALQLRHRTGRGQFIDMAMHDALLAIQEGANFALFGDGGTDTDFLCAWIYRCKGDHVVIPADPRANWSELVALMQMPELLTDPRYDTYDKREACLPELEAHVQDWVERQPSAADAVATLHARGMAAAKVLTLTEALASEQTKARRMTVPVDDRSGGTTEVLNSPYRFSDADAGVRTTAAFRGEHNAAVLSELLGLTPDELAALESEGILSARIPSDRSSR